MNQFTLFCSPIPCVIIAVRLGADPHAIRRRPTTVIVKARARIILKPEIRQLFKTRQLALGAIRILILIYKNNRIVTCTPLAVLPQKIDSKFDFMRAPFVIFRNDVIANGKFDINALKLPEC